jgi:competence ComEA-like helix-hairpin-helix protein
VSDGSGTGGSRGSGADGLDRRQFALAAIGGLTAMIFVAYAHIAEVGRGYRAPDLESTIRVNVNTADLATLSLLPEIGPERAARIIAYRERHGPLRGFPDLLHVTGIGEKTVERLVTHVRFDDEPPPAPAPDDDDDSR